MNMTKNALLVFAALVSVGCGTIFEPQWRYSNAPAIAPTHSHPYSHGHYDWYGNHYHNWHNSGGYYNHPVNPFPPTRSINLGHTPQQPPTKRPTSILENNQQRILPYQQNAPRASRQPNLIRNLDRIRSATPSYQSATPPPPRRPTLPGSFPKR